MYGGEHNMVKLDEYRQLIKEIFTTYNSHKPACGEVKVEFIFDMDRTYAKTPYIAHNNFDELHYSHVRQRSFAERNRLTIFIQKPIVIQVK